MCLCNSYIQASPDTGLPDCEALKDGRCDKMLRPIDDFLHIINGQWLGMISGRSVCCTFVFDDSLQALNHGGKCRIAGDLACLFITSIRPLVFFCSPVVKQFSAPSVFHDFR